MSIAPTCTCCICEDKTQGAVVCVDCFERRIWTARRHRPVPRWLKGITIILAIYCIALTVIVLGTAR